jgi:recombination protein RecA
LSNKLLILKKINMSDISKRIDEAREKLNKKYGKMTSRNLKKDKAVVDVISTGSMKLDIATGVGGFPLGSIVEVFGGESSGKTTLCISTISQAQKSGKICAYIDSEHAFDKNYAEKLGVDLESLIFVQPDSLEDALNITLDLIGVADVVCFDSVAAAVPEKELNGEIGDHTIGIKARLMSQAMRMIVSKARSEKCLILFVNQIREKIGVMFGSNITTPGGLAIKFAAAMRIQLRSSAKNKEDKKDTSRITSNDIVAKVIKNKLAPPHTTATYAISYFDGIYGVNLIGEVVDLALESGILKKSGSWFSLDGSNIGQGKNGAVRFFQDNDECYQDILLKLKKDFF